VIIKVVTYIEIDENNYDLKQSKIREIVKQSIHYGDVMDYWRSQIDRALIDEIYKDKELRL